MLSATPAPENSPAHDKSVIETVSIAQHLSRAQEAAKSLREKAAQVSSSQERDRLLHEAYEREVEARGASSTLAQRMRSGTWQGMFGGAGIGSGIAIGLGAVVGTLVSGIVAIPTTGLGALIGSGVGAAHGPFFKFPEGHDETKRWDEIPPEEVVEAIERAENQRRVEESDDNFQDESEVSEKDKSEQVKTEMPPIYSATSLAASSKAKKQPRKLEIRSQ